jgi:hypothetical protein
MFGRPSHSHPNHEIGIVDELVTAYVDWREECLAVRRAYASWTGADSGHAAGAYVAYNAALDREEAAAIAYADLIGAVGQLRRYRMNSAPEPAAARWNGLVFWSLWP